MKIVFSEKSLHLKRVIYFIAVLFFVLIQGCLEIEPTLTLKQDGSGSLTVDYILGEGLTKTVKDMEKTGGKITLKEWLAFNEKDLNEQFQGTGIKIKNAVFEKKDNIFHASYTVSFNNVEDLTNTKALQKGQISFYRDGNNNLAFQWGTETLRRDLGKEKAENLLEGFKADFKLTLPGKILENNADAVEENALSWNFTQEKLKPEVMTAVCEGPGLPFVAKLPGMPKKTGASGYLYDSTGKPDPFKPFIVEVARTKEVATKFLQPLQRYEYSQLKLVGIIWNIDNPRALLEDAAGKGYIISKGAYVGKNGGKVSEILTNEVIITEEETNVLGETKTKEIKIKLHEAEKEIK